MKTELYTCRLSKYAPAKVYIGCYTDLAYA